VQAGRRPPIRFVAVSRHTAAAWGPVAGPIEVVPNGVDLLRWTPGPGGGPLVWSGRIVPEKSPHLAIEAARAAGLPLQLAGPVVDHGYFDREIAPRLGDGVQYLGHLAQQALAATVGAASAALVTPDWDEPYGLVVAEALACGTPVAAFDRGGVPEVLTPECGRLVPGGDVPALAVAVREATTLSRTAARERAVTACSVESMAVAYEEIYHSLARARR
jgi:glycosyltransferase involved in cell wall biosynthesis